jgi:hypothetical protein
MTRPECADNPDRWFSDSPADITAAKAICQRCPGRNPCAEAGRDEPWGVWAGMTAGDRIGLQLLATPMPEPEEIHDRARYVRGCRCGDCKRSNASYVAEWRDRPVTEQRTVSPMAEQLAFL